MISELIKRLKTEADLYYAYQANIAMAFKDEYDRQASLRDYVDLGKLDIHEIANQAAKNFLDLLCYEPKSEDQIETERVERVYGQRIHDTAEDPASTS